MLLRAVHLVALKPWMRSLQHRNAEQDTCGIVKVRATERCMTVGLRLPPPPLPQ